MRFVIVTGMSGAGKSSALKMLEDAGYFCVDNLPVPLLTKFAEISDSAENEHVAIGMDIRSGEGLETISQVLEDVRTLGIHYEILFLDCSDRVLVKRYKETRRQHPLAVGGRIETGIAIERGKMESLKKQADYIIDTSQLLVRELKAEIDKIFINNGTYRNFYITILSFGFKYGIPSDSDLVFDVRFLPNPYYVEELKPLSGNDEPVYSYVMACKEAGVFLEKITDLILFLIFQYIQEGKNQLVISIGCTGGRHRSVTLANALYKEMGGSPYSVKIEHRDADKSAPRKAQ